MSGEVLSGVRPVPRFRFVIVAICCVVLALPFTYMLTRMARKVQVVWLVALLSILGFSVVLFSYTVVNMYLTQAHRFR